MPKYEVHVKFIWYSIMVEAEDEDEALTLAANEAFDHESDEVESAIVAIDA